LWSGFKSHQQQEISNAEVERLSWKAGGNTGYFFTQNSFLHGALEIQAQHFSWKNVAPGFRARPFLHAIFKSFLRANQCS
jgi:hypothetical protein